MTSAIDMFTQRIHDEWLPIFCLDPKRNYPLEGFKPESIKVSEQDAANFLQAIDQGLVIDSGGGRYRCDKSHAFEQIFWEGSKNKIPRPITLWLEPVITIGTIARLKIELGWPAQQLGMQSKSWAFDFTVSQSVEDEREFIAGEVKKTEREIDVLIEHLLEFSQATDKLFPPNDAKVMNSFKKWLALLESNAPYFWAVGPDGYTKLFMVEYPDENTARFNEVTLDQIRYHQS